MGNDTGQADGTTIHEQGGGPSAMTSSSLSPSPSSSSQPPMQAQQSSQKTRQSSSSSSSSCRRISLLGWSLILSSVFVVIFGIVSTRSLVRSHENYLSHEIESAFYNIIPHDYRVRPVKGGGGGGGGGSVNRGKKHDDDPNANDDHDDDDDDDDDQDDDDDDRMGGGRGGGGVDYKPYRLHRRNQATAEETRAEADRDHLPADDSSIFRKQLDEALKKEREEEEADKKREKKQQQEEQQQQQQEEQKKQQEELKKQQQEEELKKKQQEEEQKKHQEEEAGGQEKTTTTTTEEEKKPLNVVLLYADDMRHDSIGIAGANIVKTPHIDRMAREGMRFTHNCVTTSVCWISRATLYTGQYQSRHENTMPFENDWQKNWTLSWPYLLHHRAKYHVGHVGKWHHKAERHVTSVFDYWKSYYGPHIMEDGKHITEHNERHALEFLRKRPTDKPFMLEVCFFAPHAWDGNSNVYVPQNSSMHLYADDVVDAPLSFTDRAWADMPKFFTDHNEARVRFFQRFDKPEKYQSMMKNYFRLISEIDHAVGNILQELDRQNVTDETLIIFTTDNGYFHAEHGLAGKWYPHEESLRVPLVIKDPRIPKEKRGTTNDEFTLNVDLAHTILGAADVDAPSVMQGRNIAEIYARTGSATDDDPWRSEFFYEHPVHLSSDIIPASTALVRKDFKFMTWPDFRLEQLFDLRDDPLELRDLIDDPRHADLVDEMRKRHDELAASVK